MSLVARPHYTSEATDFLQQLKQQRPELDRQQVAGRSLLWDKEVDRELWSEYRAGQVQQKPYVYQSEPSQS